MSKPDVSQSLIDLTKRASSISSLVAGMASNFKWGPVDEFSLVSDYGELVEKFGPAVSPDVTPGNYQALGYFGGGSAIYIYRPKGDNLYGIAEAAKTGTIAVLPAGVDSRPKTPQVGNVVSIFTKYPGKHPDGEIKISIYDADPSNGTFGISVGTLAASTTALNTGDSNTESHKVSVILGTKDDSGKSMYLSDVLSRDSKLIGGAAKADATISDVPAESTQLIELSNSVYVAATDSDLVNAYLAFENKQAVNIDLVIPGKFSASTLNSAIKTATVRGDCFPIISPDINETWTLEGISSSTGWLSKITAQPWWCAAYASYVEITDPDNKREVEIPCAGHVAGAYAYVVKLEKLGVAPAGNRKTPISATLKSKWTDAEESALYDRRLNFLSSVGGTHIEGQKTLLDSSSDFSRINVALTYIRIKKETTPLAKGFMYEFNDEYQRTIAKKSFESYLGNLGNLLEDYYVICDEKNNNATVRNNNEFIIDLYLKFSAVSEYIRVRTTATPRGVDFATLVK